MNYIYLITLITASILSPSLQAGDLPEGYELNGVETLYSLNAKEAKRFGEDLANQDFKNGISRIFVYGLRTGPSEYEALLAVRYDVHHVRVAGCIVSEGIIEGSDAYNQTMKALLVKAFKKDVFAEVKRELDMTSTTGPGS